MEYKIGQNECFLLKMCVETDIVDKIHKGYIFDKMQRSDVMFQYQVYLKTLDYRQRYYRYY